MYDIYKDCSPEPDKIFPFAEDGWENFYHVADSFEEFLDISYPDDED